MKLLNSSKGKKYIRYYFAAFVGLILVLLVTIPSVTVYRLTGAYDVQIRSETYQTSDSIRQTVHTYIDGLYSLSRELSLNPNARDSEYLAGIEQRNTEDIELLYFTKVVEGTTVTVGDDSITYTDKGGNVTVFQILKDGEGRNIYRNEETGVEAYWLDMHGWQIARSNSPLADRHTRWWFRRMTEESKEPFVSQTYISASTGSPCASIYMPVYYDAVSGKYDSDELTYIFGADIKLTAIQELIGRFATKDLKRSRETEVHFSRYSFVIDGDGTVVAHPENSYIKTLTNYKDLVGATDGFKSAVAEVIKGESDGQIVSFDSRNYYMTYEPIELPGKSASWSVITMQDRAVAMSEVSTIVAWTFSLIGVICVLFVAVGIYFFKHLETSMKNLETAKVHAERANSGKSKFLATMSHEIRTPLNAIIGITQMQLQKEDLPRGYAEEIKKVYSSGTSLLSIINDILDLSKIETGQLSLHPAEYSLPNLINDTVQINIVRIGTKRIKFELEVDDALPSRLFGDALRIKQILNNLLSNAIKYTKEGVVKLTIEHTEDGEGGVTLRFGVEDTGAGITPENLARMFTEYLRFNEADSKVEGTGIGLAITKKLVDMMDGTIGAESEFGKGSIFSVTIKQTEVESTVPIGMAQAQALRNFNYSDENQAYKHFVVRELPDGSALIVDDIDINLYVAEAVLEPYKMKVETVNSGFAALENVNSGKVYDIILMDHMMPGMDGIETTRKLRELGYRGAIVALTANAIVGNEEMFAQNGFDGFISKPIDIRVLDGILDKFVRKPK